MPSRKLAARTLEVAAVGALAASVFAGSAGAATPQVHGTVIHRNAKAHSFVVATRAGRLYAIHAAHAPALGAIVSVAVRQLRDGTYAAHATHVGGHLNAGRRVRAHGTVSYVNHRSGTYTLSARGVSMIVKDRRAGARRAMLTSDGLPTVGSVVTATGTVDDQGDLSAATTQVDGQTAGGFDLEGTVLSVDTTASTITVSAADDDSSGATITVSVPAPLSIAAFSPGQEVELAVQLQGSTYVLTGSADDQNAQAANDQTDSQGDQADQASESDQGDDGQATAGGDGGSTSGSDSQTSTTGGDTQTSTTAAQTTTSGGDSTPSGD